MLIITLQLDDITVADPLAPTGSVGIYKGLRYNEFGIAEQVVQGEGLIPQSKPNVATFALEGELLNGIPSISPDYEGSKGQYFDLEQLYFGCTITTVTNAVNVPASCTMTFTAYDSDNNQIAEKSADYDRGAQMQQVNFGSDFDGVYKVEFTISGLVANLLQVGIVDSLKYDVYSTS